MKAIMELGEIKEILRELSACRGDVFDIEVSINGRLSRTLGRVKSVGTKTNCKPVAMEFSRSMLETVEKEDIMSVIKHEWAHYYITKTTNVDHGHDAAFKALCAEIECHGTTTIKVTRTVDVVSKYSVYCETCGKLVGEYSRQGKVVKNPSLFSSNCCKGGLKVVQNF